MEKINLLLVDDNPSGLLTLEAVLACPEYNLVTASSGEEAISHLLDYSFAVILLDVQMPGMNGFETARIIKQHSPSRDIPIIFITAISKEAQHLTEGYKTGAVDYLFKPFDPHILKCKVAVFTEMHKKNQEIREQSRRLRDANLALEIEVAERKRAQQEVIAITSAERQRIGQDLHDSIAQQMAAICMMSKVLWKNLSEKDLPEAKNANNIHELSKKAIEETKNLARGFYPIELERHGFLPAIEELILNMAKMFNLECHYDFDPDIQIGDLEIATHLYRIIQEAMYNSVKYGKAKQITIALQRDAKEIMVTVQNDGLGILNYDPSSDGMGLRIMHYRAKVLGGQLEIKPGASDGSVLTLRFRESALCPKP